MTGLPRALVNAFLKDFKRIAECRGIVPRNKNIQSMADLSLTETLAKEEIMALSVADYCAGPKPDESQKGQVWEFGKKIGGVEVYIKLKVAELPNGEKIAKCLSFHAAEFPLRFPLL